jgi:hypothetical protein
LICDAHPGNNWKFGGHDVTDYYGFFIHVVASRIRLMEIKNIPGYRSSRRWRGVDKS